MTSREKVDKIIIASMSKLKKEFNMTYDELSKETHVSKEKILAFEQNEIALTDDERFNLLSAISLWHSNINFYI